jgi:hypothetical protein
MGANHTAARAASNFSEWSVDTSTPDLGLSGEPSCLTDFLYAWLKSGHGVRACHGDFTTFLCAIPIIIEEWLTLDRKLNYLEDLDPDTLGEDENNLLEHERVVSTVFGKNRDMLILDRGFFEACTFYELHGAYAPPPNTQPGH